MAPDDFDRRRGSIKNLMDAGFAPEAVEDFARSNDRTGLRRLNTARDPVTVTVHGKYREVLLQVPISAGVALRALAAGEATRLARQLDAAVAHIRGLEPEG